MAGILGTAVSQVWAGGLRSLTTPQELALGQSFGEAVDLRFPILRDPVVTWYANLRGRQFADRSPRNDIPYFFRVIASGEINAFAIPGGHIYLNLDLFQVAELEAEALGILGHEIGHIVARHGSKRIAAMGFDRAGDRSARSRSHRLRDLMLANGYDPPNDRDLPEAEGTVSVSQGAWRSYSSLTPRPTSGSPTFRSWFRRPDCQTELKTSSPEFE